MLSPCMRHYNLVSIVLRKALRGRFLFQSRYCCQRVPPVTDVNTHTCDVHAASPDDILDASDEETARILVANFGVYQDFITEQEEQSLFDEVEPYLKRLRYEISHWDDAIHGYREMERREWSPSNTRILDRVRALSFPAGTEHMSLIHVLDLKREGYIKPHVDSVRFCGSVISGICLLSSSVMRVVNEKDPSKFADILLKRRSLYAIRDRSRYEYTHEILSEEKSLFRDVIVPRDRRISIICRNEPPSEDRDSQ